MQGVPKYLEKYKFPENKNPEGSLTEVQPFNGALFMEQFNYFFIIGNIFLDFGLSGVYLNIVHLYSLPVYN